ncbi:DUF3153 domain-containing protein [Mycolicibacterium insubricum]|uniref:DUF3153 domain-containing protein n=1 Tax=Mycolicibacterium insubricum TaxID=444597 RepID=A0A1X0DJ65_9MYCO|nr:DUF3153 domain-containing protein [Mycolicibacterium insubricum]BBZ67690.1 DUF3153 domain-containing protein [Mycolicibacterium insubricum]
MTALIWHHDRVRTPRRFRLLALAVLLLVAGPLLSGCVRVRASLTVAADDTVSGYIMAAAKPRDGNDPGPQFQRNLPFSQKVAINKYDRDGYVGSEAVFSHLTFAEVPQLANMNSEAAGVDLSFRRAGDLVILEGRVDLTALSGDDNEVKLSVAFPGEITNSNGTRVSGSTVEWQLKPGIVNTMSAQARYTDPSTRSFNTAATWMGLSALVAAAAVGGLAWSLRDRSARPGRPEPVTD